MYISAETLDDLLLRVLKALLKSKNRIEPSRGSATELTGVLLKVAHPRARLSRTEGRGLLFSCLGELLWYLAGSKSLRFITYYVVKYAEESDDGRTLHGAYGPRFLNMRGINQIENVVGLLRSHPDSRRAVIQLFDAADIAKYHKEIPCTCTLQFMVRRQRLEMFTNMRSNDAFLGLPHDVFAFTMLQEILARTLGVEVGEYKHAVGSLHLYDPDRKKAKRLVNEGWQTTKLQMPPMPIGDPWGSIRKVLKVESAIRRRVRIDITRLKLDGYWGDIVRLLEIYGKYKEKNSQEIGRLKSEMSNPVYNTYIDKKQRDSRKAAARSRPSQKILFGEE
ncbi:MAG TPA: thymidylate synthase [Candidatus Acidoferrum sp.]|nr:thymidylate synthase [Candidatus Acidoferrum sp.]